MAFASPSIPVDAAVYRRQARRIRARFANQPAAMQRALRGLAHSVDQLPWRPSTEITRRLNSPTRSNPILSDVLHTGFSNYLQDRLEAGSFTFSDRMNALNAAERIGISRFHANLMVVLAQDASSGHKPPAPSVGRHWPILLTVAVILIAECVLIGAFWAGLR